MNHPSTKPPPHNIFIKNTLYYIEKYLDPEIDWDTETPLKERMHKIKHVNVDWDVISEYINSMNYQSFLQTPYWKAISSHAKYKARYKCQICNSKNDLDTHHRSYSIHGSEHANIHDLTVLCRDCHYKFHDKFGRKERFSNRSTNPVLIFFLIFFVTIILVANL